MTVRTIGRVAPFLMATHTLSVEGSFQAGLAHVLRLCVTLPAGRELSLGAVVVTVRTTAVHATHIGMDLVIESNRFVHVAMPTKYYKSWTFFRFVTRIGVGRGAHAVLETGFLMCWRTAQVTIAARWPGYVG